MLRQPHESMVPIATVDSLLVLSQQLLSPFLCSLNLLGGMQSSNDDEAVLVEEG